MNFWRKRDKIKKLMHQIEVLANSDQDRAHVEMDDRVEEVRQELFPEGGKEQVQEGVDMGVGQEELAAVDESLVVNEEKAEI